MGLLRRDPEQRLSGTAALRRLPQDTAPPVMEMAPAPFARRRSSAATPARGIARGLPDGRATASAAAVCVCGPSGIGKSALVRAFSAASTRTDDVVVLSGRCYESESVPYKALDGVVDDLSRHLASLPRPASKPAAAGPAGLDARVPGAAAGAGRRRPCAATGSRAVADPFALRRRAFDALRELFRRVAARRPLVVCIDDLQWADADSVVLLEELLQPPGTPPLVAAVVPERGNGREALPAVVAPARGARHLVHDFSGAPDARRSAGADRGSGPRRFHRSAITTCIA